MIFLLCKQMELLLIKKENVQVFKAMMIQWGGSANMERSYWMMLRDVTNAPLISKPVMQPPFFVSCGNTKAVNKNVQLIIRF